MSLNTLATPGSSYVSSQTVRESDLTTLTPSALPGERWYKRVITPTLPPDGVSEVRTHHFAAGWYLNVHDEETRAGQIITLGCITCVLSGDRKKISLYREESAPRRLEDSFNGLFEAYEADESDGYTITSPNPSDVWTCTSLSEVGIGMTSAGVEVQFIQGSMSLYIPEPLLVMKTENAISLSRIYKLVTVPIQDTGDSAKYFPGSRLSDEVVHDYLKLSDDVSISLQSSNRVSLTLRGVNTTVNPTQGQVFNSDYDVDFDGVKRLNLTIDLQSSVATVVITRNLTTSTVDLGLWDNVKRMYFPLSDMKSNALTSASLSISSDRDFSYSKYTYTVFKYSDTSPTLLSEPYYLSSLKPLSRVESLRMPLNVISLTGLVYTRVIPLPTLSDSIYKDSVEVSITDAMLNFTPTTTGPDGKVRPGTFYPGTDIYSWGKACFRYLRWIEMKHKGLNTPTQSTSPEGKLLSEVWNSAKKILSDGIDLPISLIDSPPGVVSPEDYATWGKLYYDSVWKGYTLKYNAEASKYIKLNPTPVSPEVYGYTPLNAPSLYGFGFYNDHHFHWGYFLYAVYVCHRHGSGEIKQEIEGNDNLSHVLGDVVGGNSRVDYPLARHMDWWEGHSWATGLVDSDGKEQESSSEAVLCYWSAQALLSLFPESNLNRREHLEVASSCLALEVLSSRFLYRGNHPIFSPFISKIQQYGLARSLDFSTTGGVFYNYPPFTTLAQVGIITAPFGEWTDSIVDDSWIEALKRPGVYISPPSNPSSQPAPTPLQALISFTDTIARDQTQPVSSAKWQAAELAKWARLGQMIIGSKTPQPESSPNFYQGYSSAEDFKTWVG
jgi:hypothetical protein